MALKSDKRLTLSDLAKLAGVSTSTASRALSDNPVIKEQTRRRIQTLAKQHNYSLNAAASRLRTRRTRVVAVILNLTDHTEQSINDPFLLKVVGDLNQSLNERGYELLLSNSFMATDDWANYFIASSRADGLIVVGQGKDDSRIKAAYAAGAPIVVWGAPQGSVEYPVIGSDNRLGGFIATQHLIDTGHRRIAFLGDPEHAELKERHLGYCDALEQAGIDIDPLLTLSIDITSHAAYEKVNALILSRGLVFDSIFANSDMVALGALKALKERYIAIPGEVSIVGFDDVALAELFHPSLSTIRQNTATAAEKMVEQLLLQLDGQPGSDQIIDIELIVRASSGSR